MLVAKWFDPPLRLVLPQAGEGLACPALALTRGAGSGPEFETSHQQVAAQSPPR